MLDLSLMKSVRVDPAARTARVEPGVTLGDFDREAQAFGLATPLGINSTTGVAGLTLGGGFGWLSRKHGLTIDNLLSADVVTADGAARARERDGQPRPVLGDPRRRRQLRRRDVVRVPAPSGRAGGPVRPDRPSVRPGAGGARRLPPLRRLGPRRADRLGRAAQGPAAPLPSRRRSTARRSSCSPCATSGTCGRPSEAVAPLQAIGKPIADVVGPHPFAGWQTAFDPLLTPGARNYWKSHDFKSSTTDSSTS